MLSTGWFQEWIQELFTYPESLTNRNKLL